MAKTEEIIEKSKAETVKAKAEKKISSNLKKTESKVKTEKNAAAEKTADSVTKKATATLSNSSKEPKYEEITNKKLASYVRSSFSGTTSDNVAMLIDTSIDKIVAQETKIAVKTMKKTPAGEAYVKADSLYKQISKSDKVMTTMRTAYTASMNKTVEKSVNKKVAGLLSPLQKNKFTRKLVNQSKLSKAISADVNKMVNAAIKGVASDKNIAAISKDIKTMQKKAENYVKQNFASQIAYAAKLEKASKDKIAMLEKEKQKYLKRVTDTMNAYQKKINAAVQKYEKAALDEINKAVKNMLAGIKKI